MSDVISVVGWLNTLGVRSDKRLCPQYRGEKTRWASGSEFGVGLRRSHRASSMALRERLSSLRMHKRTLLILGAQAEKDLHFQQRNRPALWIPGIGFGDFSWLDHHCRWVHRSGRDRFHSQDHRYMVVVRLWGETVMLP